MIPAAARLLVGAAAAASLAPATAAAGWGRPFRIAGPFTQDVLPVQAAVSATGAAAVGFGTVNGDDPTRAAAFSVGSGGAGFGGPRRLGRELDVLAVAFDGPRLVVLAGTAPRGRPCCASAQVISGGVRRTVFGHLAGAADGQLIALPDGGLTAVIAADNGLWAATAPPGRPFGPARRLSAAAKLPSAVAASGSAVAWTAVAAGEVATRTIFVARGPRGRGRVAFRVPARHAVEELGIADGPGAPTVVWVESWFGPGGGYHSSVLAADVGGRPLGIAPRAEQAAALSVASDLTGDVLVSWKGCAADGACGVRAVLRPAGRRFGPVRRLGAIDPSQSPVACMTAGGRGFVGWVAPSGNVRVASTAGRIGAARTVSRTSYASDLTLAAGPGGAALAAWTQGTLAAEVVAARYRLG